MPTTWSYNGSGSLAITFDSVAGVHYFASCSDSGSAPASGTAAGSTKTLTVTGIGGDAAGYGFEAFVQKGDSTGVDTPHPWDCIAANVFAEGTASTTGVESDTTWSYDGATALSVTFTALAGVTYFFGCQSDRSLAQQSVTGGPYTAGTSHTLSLTLHTPARTTFEAVLFNNSTNECYADTILTAGAAGSTPGSPPLDPQTVGRVLIAWDDGPLVAAPTWTVIDQGGTYGGATFPYNFVSGYDTRSGRQTLISQTETGTATVYVNDRSGLFDDRNGSSPFQGKLSGRQIMLQLYNPVDATWEPQFRGLIDDYRYTIDGTAVGADGNPVNASVEIDCVDMFDYLNSYLLTPGLDGVAPTTGAKDSIYYAPSGAGDFVGDRVLEILTDARIDPTMSVLASGNVQVIETQYNSDESALSALRDAADAELPFIANIYINRSGLFCFRGRYSRFAPDAVAAAGSFTWDFTRWPMGDGKAIQADPTRAQVRLLTYSRDRGDLINAAMCYPQGTPATAIPDQVYADSSSTSLYGKHMAAPLTNLITGKYAGPGTISPDDGKTQCYLYAELLVKNKKDPRICPTAIQLKSINPSDFRASATWAVLTRSDISHIANVAVGYPGGTGLMGGATTDDYYIEGRALTVRPANSAYDYVELDLELSPFVWSADTHGVFPTFGT